MSSVLDADELLAAEARLHEEIQRVKDECASALAEAARAAERDREQHAQQLRALEHAHAAQLEEAEQRAAAAAREEALKLALWRGEL